MANTNKLQRIIIYKFTYVWHSIVLHHIFADYSLFNCKENFKFSIIIVGSFEEILLTDNKFISKFS